MPQGICGPDHTLFARNHFQAVRTDPLKWQGWINHTGVMSAGCRSRQGGWCTTGLPKASSTSGASGIPKWNVMAHFAPCSGETSPAREAQSPGFRYNLPRFLDYLPVRRGDLHREVQITKGYKTKIWHGMFLYYQNKDTKPIKYRQHDPKRMVLSLVPTGFGACVHVFSASKWPFGSIWRDIYWEA